MRIRPAKLSDVGKIYDIARDELSREEWFDRKELVWIIRSNPKSCWVMENEGKVLGARLTCETWATTAWGWLVAIRKDLRHQHLGTFLFDETCRLLKRQGMTRIMTDVYTGNGVSVNWHRKMGYRRLGLVKDWFDNGKDAIIFCKEL